MKEMSMKKDDSDNRYPFEYVNAIDAVPANHK